MKIDLIARAIILLSTALYSAFCVGACGTITGASTEVLEIHVTPGNKVTIIDSSEGLRGPVRIIEDGRIFITMRTGPVYLLKFYSGEVEDSLYIGSRIRWDVMIPELLLFPPIGTLVDGLTSSQFALEDDSLVFDATPASDSIFLTIHNANDDPSSDRPYRLGDHGILLGLSYGLRFPFSPALIFFNDVSLTIGYRPLEQLGVLFQTGYANWLEYAEEESIEMAATRSAKSLEIRYYPPFLTSSFTRSGLYLVGNIGHAEFSSPSILSTSTRERIPESSFNQSMLTAGGGIGYSAVGAYIEWRREYGFEKLDVMVSPERSTSVPVVNMVVRWGMHVEL